MRFDLQGKFVLQQGFQDDRGAWHREGILRAATARDEMRVLSDFRVYLRPEWFLPLAIAATVVRLGTLPRVDVGIIERLSETDRSRLEGLYRELNGYPVETGPIEGGSIEPGSEEAMPVGS